MKKTKAMLEAEIVGLRRDLQAAQSVLERRPLDTWIATNDPGQPVCISAASEDFSVHVYTTEDGTQAVGVVVAEGTETVFAAGVIAAKAVMAEIAWLRRSS